MRIKYVILVMRILEVIIGTFDIILNRRYQFI